MGKMNEIRWSSHNLARFLRSTGERPERVQEMRRILGALGMASSGYLGIGGVFDHGRFYARAGKPVAIVGFPYRITADERRLLDELRRFPSLRVSVDDRPSEYGFGTHRVCIELPEPRPPFNPGRSTAATRRVRRLARAAFRAEGLPVGPQSGRESARCG